jgi:hypothetical protein
VKKNGAMVLGTALVLGLGAGAAFAKVTPEEAAKLGQGLTPIGAEKAGSKDGSIPAWTPLPQSGSLKGAYPTNPEIDGEKAQFTITKANMDQYQDKLTEGYKYLLKTYDDYKMNVYPSHRIASWPDFIYKATAENAVNCEMIGTDNPNNCKLGFPFPIPKSGAEPIWNHKLKWRGEAVTRYNNQMIVQPGGQYQLTKIVEDVEFHYASHDHPVPLTKDYGEFLFYLSKTVAPPRMAGTFILVHEKAGTGAAGRAAWLYSPGLRRIRRAPTVCCDNPYEGTDGHQFYDQVDMYNGVLERYTWKIQGKKEMYIGYNSNRIAGNKVKYKDIAAPHHVNQELPRYELHRVWVVEATVKAGTSHIYKRRTFYIDEDNWGIALVDIYDNRDQLWRWQEAHPLMLYDKPYPGVAAETVYDLLNNRYLVQALSNEDQEFVEQEFPQNYFDPANVSSQAIR